MMAPMDARRAVSADIPSAAATLAGGFHDDPSWSWVFVDPKARRAQMLGLWTLFLEGSIEAGGVWMTPGAEAVTLWIPPGRPELAEPHAERMWPLFDELLAGDVSRATVVMEQFSSARPDAPDHWYLSLFGTRADCRGQGIGMGLLRHNLAVIDEAGEPAYLESTNATNLERYRSVRFVDHGEFTLPDGGPVVTTMWRDAR